MTHQEHIKDVIFSVQEKLEAAGLIVVTDQKLISSIQQVRNSVDSIREADAAEYKQYANRTATQDIPL